MLAGILSALCLTFAWRAYRRARRIQAEAAGLGSQAPEDAFEERLAEQELNLELNLAGRTVKALARASLFAGTGLGVWSVATGAYLTDPRQAYFSFGAGLIGWMACRELQRRIGSLAESWRATAKQRRRRQGVDQLKRTGVA